MTSHSPHLAQAGDAATLRRLPLTARWLLPPLLVTAIGFLGILLYFGGLGSPTDHMRDVPVAVVNQDQGATVQGDGGSGQRKDLGSQLTQTLVQKASDSGEFDLQVMSRDQADEALARADVYAAVVIPENFSARTTALVPAAMGGTDDGTRPTIELVTSPQAGSMSTRLVTDGLTPALEQASTTIGEDLAKTADQQVQARQQAGQRIPGITPVAQEVLKDPVSIDVHAWQALEDGTALGMGPFYWSIVLLVVGLTGSVAVTTLVDGILGIVPIELGSRFRRYPTVALSRLATFTLKWVIMVVAAAATVGLMMWAAAVVGMPMPHGGQLYLTSWLAVCTVATVTLALLTVGGSAGLILSMLYLVFLGLPSAGAVVPVEALPDFFARVARVEPLHYTWLGVRDLLFFDAAPSAGLDTAVLGLVTILLCSVALAVVVAPLWDRLSGRRGVFHGQHNAGNSIGARP